MPVPIGTLSRVRWDFARARVFCSLEAITSPGPGTTDSTGASLERVIGVTLGKAQEAGKGKQSSLRDRGEDALLFTGKWQICPVSSWSLGKTICFLFSSLGQGLEKEPEPDPRLPSVRERLQGALCSAGCSSMISHQCPGPWLSVLCLWENPRLWKMQKTDPVVTHVYRVVIRMGKHGR